jgi:hypothetical protein
MRRLAIAFAVLQLAGCAQMAWVRPDATPEQVQQDLAQCDEMAWREASYRAWAYQPLTPAVVRDSFGRPYFIPFDSLVRSPFDDRFFEEHRLSHFCMRAKGYDLQQLTRKDGG